MVWSTVIDSKKEYYNDLNIKAFSASLDNTVACYKIYWIDAIITTYKNSGFKKHIISFDELFAEMIFQAWYTKAYYKLRLGSYVGGSARKDAIEESIELLQSLESIKDNAPEQEVRQVISDSQLLLKDNRKRIEKYVPIRFLSPFVKLDSNNYKVMIPVINELFRNSKVPYRILVVKGEKYIEIDTNWSDFFEKEYVLLKKWISLEKCSFLEKYNQEVPGIISKLELVPCNRNLTKLRHLWNTILPSKELNDIFTGNNLSNDSYALDHFIPWSFIANNELWNISPIDPKINSSKGDYLPDWKYIDEFCKSQYVLYKYLNIYKSEKTIINFNRCVEKHLCAEWAEILYREKTVNEQQFSNELIEHLSSYYKTAKSLGFQVWAYSY